MTGDLLDDALRDARGAGEARHRPVITILGTRLGRYVEFEYSLDRDLAVELVMPFTAFEEFRTAQRAEVHLSDRLAASDRDAVAARPGLYRSPAEHRVRDASA